MRQLLDAHPTLKLVVVSDTDTVWLREPWAYFEQRPAPEFFISTDCLSVQVLLFEAAAARPLDLCLPAATTASQDGAAARHIGRCGQALQRAASAACALHDPSAHPPPAGLACPQTEEDWKKEHGQPRCGHIPDNNS